MTSKNISMMPVRCYPSPLNTKVFRDLPLGEYLMMCQEDNYVRDICDFLATHQKGTPEYDQKKKINRCCTISCINKAGERNDMDIEKRNPLICIDIDLGDNPWLAREGVLEKLQDKLFEKACVYASGISCSGKGLFLIIYLGTNYDDVEFKAAFYALQKEFADAKIVIDKSCCNISRLRYSSSHKVKIKAPNTEVAAYKERFYMETHRQSFLTRRASYMGVPKIEILREVISMLLKHGYASDDYNSWLVDGFALYPLGDEGLQLYDMISRASSNYKGFSDVQKKFSQVSNSNWTEDDCYRRFFGLAKRIIGPGSTNQAVANILNKFNNPQNVQNLY